ncbi:MAG: polysaccharide export protein [Bacteroidia bacterium]|nr:polysaccharide export protein [Bacteroidia bacterium]
MMKSILFKQKSGYFSLLLFVLMFLSSCLNRKHTDYFQKDTEARKNMDTLSMPEVFEPKIEPNDILAIHISSINAEAASFFNPAQSNAGEAGTEMTNYLVDLKGEIEIPLVGKLKVQGQSTREVREALRQKLEKYLQDPSVRIYLESFKVTLLGEVKLPGVYQVKNEKLTLPDALGLAGDMTIYGDRKSVMVIRNVKGQKVFSSIDLTTRDIFQSEYYYLRPGDVVYVAAGKGRLASADAFYRIAPLVISALSLIAILATRVN